MANSPRFRCRRFPCAALLMVLFGGLVSMAAALPEALPSPALHNLFRVSTRVFSGGSPESDNAFAELRRLGVTTIVSVDGARPDIETARTHGLRYVHLPIGYDGISAERIAQLVKAGQSATNVLYVHCHHGKHRGPSAAAILCLATDTWSTHQAVDWLRRAGTSPDYPGLYRSVAEFTLPDATTLAGVTSLPETSDTSSLVESMVRLDAHAEHLRSAQATGWMKIPGHPDLEPRHEATLLWELLRELARHASTSHPTEDYRTMLTASEQAADALRSALASSPPAHDAADASFKKLGTSCTACHRAHRN